MSRFIITCFILLAQQSITAQITVPLYSDRIPNSKRVENVERVEPNSKVDSLTYNVSVPSLTFFPAQHKVSSASIIIIPGGGYQVLLTKREGSDIARQLNKAGYSCFVLKYRLPDENTSPDKSIVPIQDVQQAFKLVRQHAARWDVNPDSVGLMGFSAGGHLVSTAVTHFNTNFVGNDERYSLRPAFAILINPVVSFSDSFAHKGTRERLLGSRFSSEQADFFSAEKNVRHEMPPCLFIHSREDTVVYVENSLNLFLALRKKNIPSAIHIYSRGEHGLLTAPPFAEWFGRCVYWLNNELKQTSTE